MDTMTVTTGAELVVVAQDPLDQNPAAVYLAHLGSEAGRRTMRQALNVIARLASSGAADYLSFPWASLRFQHTAAMRAALAERYQPAGANKMLAALRGTLKAAWRLGQMTAEDYQRACDLEGVRGSTVPAGRDLKPGEVAALLAACCDDGTPAGVRDGAVIALLCVAGPRRSEIVGLDLADFDPGEVRLLIRHGKGSKERTVYLDNGSLEAMADWLAVRGQAPGPLFVAINKGGELALGRRLSAQAVYNLLEKRRGQAKVKKFSPHDLRRTVAGDLLDVGVDIVTVSKILGHANVATTARYDRRPEETKRQAAARLHVPYRRQSGPSGRSETAREVKQND